MTIASDGDSNARCEYTPSRHIADFHLAGFAYYDGLDVIDRLVPGQPVQLVKEEHNPYDDLAVAIVLDGKKLGYVPRTHNWILATPLRFGHGDIYEARIQAVNMQAHPERQLRIVVKIVDRFAGGETLGT